MFTVVKKWDSNFIPSGVGVKPNRYQAEKAVTKFKKLGYSQAFMFTDNSPEGQECWRIPKAWIVNPETKRVSFQQAVFDAHTDNEHMRTLTRKRDKMLDESRDQVLPDVWDDMSDAERLKWKTYRNELRNLHTTTNDLANPVWPTKPK